MNPKPTQEDRILHLLQAAWPEWVPAPALSRISLQYSRAIFSLRKREWQISNRVIIRDGVRHGSFRLGPPPIEKRISPAVQAPVENWGGLFGDLEPDRSHRE